MRIAILGSSLARRSGRLDPKHLFASSHDDGSTAGPHRRLGDIARLWGPSRFKRVYATADEERVPYLRPYDIFDYLPGPADWLSRSRSVNLDELTVVPGTILQTCSGRNLGPAVLADSYLAAFAFSHDLVRIEIDDPVSRLATLAYLRTRAGRGAIARDRAGSVIDHLTPAQLAAIPVPELASAEHIAELVARAGRLRDLARRRLRALVDKAEAAVPLPMGTPLRDGWSASSARLAGRLDAAFHNPFVVDVRERLRSAGASAVADLASVEKPGGRYSPRYVAPEYGEPLLSGRQILQWFPIAMKHVAAISFRDVEAYRLRPGTVVYQADGRAEEGLGTPGVVTAGRAGWLASGHVGRIVTRPERRWGAVYLGLASRHGQVQIRAAASGSVVDSTFPDDMSAVLLPPVTAAMAASAERAWAAIAAADELEHRATEMCEASLPAAAHAAA